MLIDSGRGAAAAAGHRLLLLLLSLRRLASDRALPVDKHLGVVACQSSRSFIKSSSREGGRAGLARECVGP